MLYPFLWISLYHSILVIFCDFITSLDHVKSPFIRCGHVVRNLMCESNFVDYSQFRFIFKNRQHVKSMFFKIWSGAEISLIFLNKKKL